MQLIDAIQYVGSGLTLISFIVSVVALTYQRKLKSEEAKLSSAPESERVVAAQIAAEYIHIDLIEIPPSERANIVFEQLRIKSQRQWQFFISFVVISFIIGAGTLTAIALDPDDPNPGPMPRETSDNGWAWVGYLDQATLNTWATGPFFEIESYSGSPNRPYPVRVGDVIRLRKDLPQVIAGYSSSGRENVLKPPPELTTVINPDRDYTGYTYKKDDTFLVLDVQVWSIPDKDAVVWLRLTHGDPDTDRREPPQPSVNTTVEYQVCIGEHERECGQHNVHLSCSENVEAWAAKQCQSLAGEVAAVSRFSVKPGNKCGYNKYTVLCSVTR
ncbi:hypothetical protein GVN24_26895 [Rhizobium sp. CRIBSB]|nr:hypothetical protein [Rhizobium sp. CRIBSB]